MKDIAEQIVNKLKQLIEADYKLLIEKDKYLEGNWIENGDLVLQYSTDLEGGVNILLGSKQDTRTYILLEHERIPHYAPLEHECRHSFKETIHGNSFSSSWIDEIDNLRKKLKERK